MDEFNVIDPSEVMDLSEVRQQRVLLPATSNARLQITGATVRTAETGDASGAKVITGRWLRVTFRLMDGIGPDGKWAGKVMDQDFQFWAHPSKEEGSEWYRNKQHLVQFKLLCAALGLDLKAIQVTDEFLSGMVGREVLGNITVEKERVKNPETGNYESSGEMVNRIKNLKRIP